MDARRSRRSTSRSRCGNRFNENGGPAAIRGFVTNRPPAAVNSAGGRRSCRGSIVPPALRRRGCAVFRTRVPVASSWRTVPTFARIGHGLLLRH